MACQWSRNVNTWLVKGVEMLILGCQWSRNVNTCTWVVNGLEMLLHGLSTE